MPPIGQVIQRWYNGQWVDDWLIQKRVGDEQFVLMWGNVSNDNARVNVNNMGKWRNWYPRQA